MPKSKGKRRSKSGKSRASRSLDTIPKIGTSESSSQHMAEDGHVEPPQRSSSPPALTKVQEILVHAASFASKPPYSFPEEDREKSSKEIQANVATLRGKSPDIINEEVQHRADHGFPTRRWDWQTEKVINDFASVRRELQKRSAEREAERRDATIAQFDELAVSERQRSKRKGKDTQAAETRAGGSGLSSAQRQRDFARSEHQSEESHSDVSSEDDSAKVRGRPMSKK